MPKVKLKDVVCRIKDKVDKDNTELEYYIGGEHFDNGEITITNKGVIEGSTIGPAFHMKFMPGDVLLMSRNPHLRKAAVVDFEGICSDVSYVCRTKDESVLLQRFLPFIFQTDHFWKFAEENKKGSTNFFLNWSDFERYEFFLPDIDKQKELVELLWSLVDTKEAYKNLLQKTDELVKSQFIEMFGDPIQNDMEWPVEQLSKVAPRYSPKIEVGEKVWLLNLDMVENDTGNIIEKVYVSPDEIGTSTCTFNSEMVLYSKLRPYLNKVVMPDGEGYATSELVPMLPQKNKLRKEFLAALLRGDQFLSYAVHISSGARMPRMPVKVLKAFNCILPPIELQDTFITFMEQSEKSKKELKQAIESTDNLIKSILYSNLEEKKE